MQQKFTKELYDLYVCDELNIADSLRLIRDKPLRRAVGEKGRIQKTASFLYENLEKGNLFSNGIKNCPYIKFDDVYAAFVALAEKNDSLKKSIKYLNQKCEREKKVKEKMLSAFIYPCIVIIFTFFICLLLCFYFEKDKQVLIFKWFLCLTALCIALLCFIKKRMGTNKVYEAFLALSFLIEEGTNLSFAMEYAIQILGIDSRLGRNFAEAKERIEFGMNLENAFCLEGGFKEAFYYADATGKKSEIFLNVAKWLEKKDERRRALFMVLIEPLFIALTGAFLLLLVINFFMPFMTDFSWV